MRKLPLVVVLDNVRSLYNVGAIFRTCDGAGVEKLYLTGITGYPGQAPRTQKQIEKTALGTIESVDWEYKKSALRLIKDLKKRGYQIVALEKTGTSIEYLEPSIKYQFPLVLVVGNEIKGVSKAILNNAYLVVHIPMHGMAKSLNVATATGIMLYYLKSIRNTF